MVFPSRKSSAAFRFSKSATRIPTPVSDDHRSRNYAEERIVRLAGANRSGIDFRSLLPLLRGEPGDHDRVIYAAMFPKAQRAIIDGDHKLVLYLESSTRLLFNLAADPLESHDLAADPDQAPRMKRLFARDLFPMQAIRAAALILRLLPLVGLPASLAARAEEPGKLSLWPEQAPVGDGTFEKAAVTITVHRPEKPNGVAMVICPGGGYGGLVTGGEGHGIAKWLNGRGITGVVLEYRLPKGRSAVPLLDARRAIRTVRAKAKDWGVDPAKVGIIGFSAGGHLAATAATRHDDGDPAAQDPVERQGCRPDFAVLVYPVITMGEGTHGGSRNNLLGPSPGPEAIELFSAEKQVTARTSPTYLAHAVDDRIVPVSHSRSFLAALRENDVPAEYLELPSGDHGLDGYQGPMWDAWQAGVLQWLAARGVLP
jgi:acetyl esterase/lipase